ncbi:MAG: hypothetical protein U1F29_13955 [Planctomycetota bacterium]
MPLPVLLAALAPALLVPQDLQPLRLSPTSSHSPATAAITELAPAVPDPARVHYTQPSDLDNAAEQPQVIWARGAQYKASFGADGATYYPILGEKSTQHHPLALSPSAVTVGGEPLEFGAGALAARAHDHVAFARGPFVETYDLTPDAIEQSFVFASLPRAGELVVTIPLDTDLALREGPDGVELEHELGRVTYTGAVAIDARGARRAASMHVVDGAVELRVDAEFLAHATLPVTLDPVVSTFVVDGTANRVFRRPDVAYDPDSHTWLVVYGELVNGEYDPIYAFYGDDPSAGQLSTGFVDLSTNSWLSPHCADNRAARQFLIVGDVNVGSTYRVDGRWLPAPGSSAPSLLRTVGVPTINSAAGSRVGGDPRASGPTPYCLTYSDLLAGAQFVVRVGILDTNGNFASGSPYTLGSQPGAQHLLSAISRSNDGVEWTLAWERHASGASSSQIWTARVGTNGAITDPAHVIVTSVGAEQLTTAAVSSPIPGTRINLVAWQKFDGVSQYDAWMQMLNPDPSSSGQFNHSYPVELGTSSLSPAVEYDGSKFQVVIVRANGSSTELGSLEDHPVFLGFAPTVPNGATLWSNSSFDVGGNSTLRAWPSLACPVVAGADPSFVHRAAIVSLQYATTAGSGSPSTVRGTVADTESGGFLSSYCSGDGSIGACPCNNNGAIGHGCANSINAAGALLDASGVNSMLNDTFALHVTGVPATTTCWFFQENVVDGTPFTFGDGLRCGTGTIVRLKTKAAASGAATYPVPGETLISVRGQLPPLGAMVAYQVSYRNAQTFCTSSTLNITNGVLAIWTP